MPRWVEPGRQRIRVEFEKLGGKRPRERDRTGATGAERNVSLGGNPTGKHGDDRGWRHFKVMKGLKHVAPFLAVKQNFRFELDSMGVLNALPNLSHQSNQIGTGGRPAIDDKIGVNG